jgi:cyclophilin family peptidyl-prolyl cis-trans isomerase
MKKVFLLIISSFFLFGCSQNNVGIDLEKPIPTDKLTDNIAESIDIVNRNKIDETPTPTSSLKINIAGQQQPQGTQNTTSMIKINTQYGDIIIKLYNQHAPNFVNNFLSKIQNKYFDGLNFHRVVPGFVAQGGDPKGDGTGGGQIASEINDIPFVRGSIGVARGGDIKINNDSQFFICLTSEACSQLTSQYTNFGEVVSGMEFVDKIVVGDKILSITTQ